MLFNFNVRDIMFHLKTILFRIKRNKVTLHYLNKTIIIMV